MLSADSPEMNSGILKAPNAIPFAGMDSNGPWAGRVSIFIVVLCLHAGFVVWILHVRQDLPAVLEPNRVYVRLVEVAVPAPPVVVPEAMPEPVQAPPKLAPPAVRAPVPRKPAARATVRKVEPQPPLQIAPPQAQVAEARTHAPRAVPAVTEARFDADYLNNPPPVYPAMSQRKGEQGKVLLLVQVSAQGTAERVEIRASSGHLLLDSAALEAVKRWRFVPARHGDRAVAASVVVPIVFRLGGK